MTDYDFKTLNDKEFEILCTDLLSKNLGKNIERFKPGKDAGVDGRYFSDDGTEIILQCKHWANTPISKLINTLKRDEKPKIDKINPSRYILAISNPLSRIDKKKISEALKPHIIQDNDIFGKEDLNDLLKRFPSVEKDHYKLWLNSTNVIAAIIQSGILGRSDFLIDEIAKKAPLYAVTENHKKALKILDDLGILIISGDPGVGKTTLANHLCLHYATKGFKFVNVISDIKEAEQLFSEDTKQIFYFDDFLGRNYLEALNGYEGGYLAAFMRRISNNNLKKFILTSRSTILNQGKFLIDVFENENLKRNEYELRIDSLSEIDKGRILYNHIWHSGLPDDFREEFYTDKRYRQIISHKNFNPRLISFITDPTRTDSSNVREYWPYIEKSLKDPSQIWEHPFNIQADASQRAIVLMVVLNRKPIEESRLADAFHRFVERPGNQSLRGRHDFGSYIRLLTGSFLNRILSKYSKPSLDLFNPSIGDFVLKKYSMDPKILKDGVISLRTVDGLKTILNIKRAGLISENVSIGIFNDILVEADREEFYNFPVSFISQICNELILSNVSGKHFSASLRLIIKNGLIDDNDASLSVIRWGLSAEKIAENDAYDFLKRNLEEIQSEDQIEDAMSIIKELSLNISEKNMLEKEINYHVVNVIEESIEDFIDIDEAFQNLGWHDTSEAEDNIVNIIEEKFYDLGVKISNNKIREIARSMDIEDRLQSYIMRDYKSYERRDSQPNFVNGPDEVDDLFDRS